MTLILTALCRDGICVCADKRYRVTHSDGKVENEDNCTKIYKFNQAPLIIFNHGVNKINNRYWDEFCSDYEQSSRWRNNSFSMIVSDFRNFLDNDVQNQLRNEQLLPEQDRAIGFVLCGKTFQDSKFRIKELFWSFKSGNVFFQSKSHVGLVRSGDGKKYLENYLNNKESNLIDYWKRMSIDQAKKELPLLFQIAVNERIKIGGEEFSNDYDIFFITK